MNNSVWKIFGIYILMIILTLFSYDLSAQDITVRYFNAEWNAANKVSWCHSKKGGLKDCKILSYDIGKDAKAQSKYKIVVVPTIIIFKDGEEIKRFQADVSFKMAATKEEVQEYIDEQLIGDF